MIQSDPRVVDLLAILALKLGVSIEYLWAVMVSGVHDEAMLAFKMIYAGIVFTGVGILSGIADTYFDDHHHGSGVCLIFAAIGIGVGILMIALNIYPAYMGTHNAEYVALQQLITAVGGHR